jgi:hypothetical protein
MIGAVTVGTKNTWQNDNWQNMAIDKNIWPNDTWQNNAWTNGTWQNDT